MFKSFLNYFNESKSHKENKGIDDHLMVVSGLLVETASVDGTIDDSEIDKIKETLSNFFGVSEKKLSYIVDQSLEKADEPNSLHFFTSKINKEFEYENKVKLLEILWEIILADGKIHDFESNLIRRLSGLLYVSDIDCGNAKKRSLTKTEED